MAIHACMRQYLHLQGSLASLDIRTLDFLLSTNEIREKLRIILFTGEFNTQEQKITLWRNMIYILGINGIILSSINLQIVDYLFSVEPQNSCDL